MHVHVTSARILRHIMKARTISSAPRSTPASRKSSYPLRALLGARGSGTATAVCVVVVFLLFLVVGGFVLVAGLMVTRSFVVAALLLVAVETPGVASAAFMARVVRRLMMYFW